MKNILIIGLCLSLIGCATVPVKQERPLDQLQYGMTKLQMINLLGRPDAVEIYKKSDETRVEYDLYAREYQSSEEKVPVCLINNRIVGWGKSFYQDHVKAEDIRIK